SLSVSHCASRGEFGLLGRDCRTTKMRKRDARPIIALNAARIRLCVKTLIPRLAQTPGTSGRIRKAENSKTRDRSDPVRGGARGTGIQHSPPQIQAFAKILWDWRTMRPPNSSQPGVSGLPMNMLKGLIRPQLVLIVCEGDLPGVARGASVILHPPVRRTSCSL